VDFLSRSTITGFMGGTAMIIIMQQLKGLLGMKHFTPKTDLISVVGSIFQYRHEVSLQTLPPSSGEGGGLVLGLSTLFSPAVRAFLEVLFDFNCSRSLMPDECANYHK
jgi:hypothetical protein